MVGTKTNVITAAQVTDRMSHDSPMLPTLVNVTSDYFDVQQVSADKGYSSARNLEAITAAGAEPFVAFKINATGTSKTQLWSKAFHFFQMNREEFLTRYHSRSNVESTFSAIKRKFGDTIRSKTPTAQRNELLLKVLCHNIVCLIHEIHESGATGMFPALIPACPKTDALAQNGLDS